MMNAALIATNTKRWNSVVFHQTALNQAAPVARRLVAAKDRYVSLSNKTGVPWYVIAVIHEREASQRWDRSIAQGDPWNHVSTHIPKGRGPFKSWEEAGVDALTKCAPYASRWSDWSIGGVLTLLELYNGVGYENRGIASPYIWSGTNQYVRGKYVSDGVFDGSVVDAQLGCAVLIDAMRLIDPTIMSEDDTVDEQSNEDEPTVETPKAGPVGDAEDSKPASQSTTIWSALAAIPTAIFGMLTDWKMVAALGVIALVGYIIYERSQKKDIKGLF